MFFSKLKKEARDLERLESIIAVFVKYGFGCILEKIPFHPFVGKRPGKEDLCIIPLASRLRKAFEELGPTFIKLGQMLSLRPDVIPYEFCEEFEKLQDNVPAVEFNRIKEVIEANFHKPLSKIFKNFPAEPVASASLAQVYEVDFNGEKAIVKVEKPGLEKTIKTDIEIMEYVASLIEKHIKEAAVYNPKGIVEEFKKYIFKELDFRNEVVNIEKFRKNFKDRHKVYFPHVYRALSSDRILVTEKIDGIKISDLKSIEKHGFNKKRIARVIVSCVLKQMFIDGFFHADPHPGNIFILKNGRIAFVDFGIVGRLNEASKSWLTNIFLAAVDKDVERIIESFREVGALGRSDEARLKMQLLQMFDKYYGIELKEFNMGEFLNDTTKLLYENKVVVLPDFFILIKSLTMLESIGKMLDPEFNMTVEIKRLLDIAIKEERSPRKIARKFKRIGVDFFSLAQNFPRDILSILNDIKKGNLKIGFEHTNLENLISILDKLSNRLSFSLIIAALIIGSSVLINANTHTLFGASFHLGIIGFILAGILGLWLLINILRSGKL
ncbi:MAG: AarF/ABC1/UbiB kinase family protein [Candidatus Omnitrophica bacterium]|nr:AarF/ABC1/UbiB kinase family protein [Candidatus Omnitrophota bacterium]